MIEEQLVNIDFRRQIIQEIKSDENRKRMENSERETNIFSGTIYPYVKKHLLNQFDSSTVDEMPIVSSINVCKKMISSKASIYKEKPEREFTNVNEIQYDCINIAYKDSMLDFKMLKANQFLELQRQTHLIVIPKDKKLIARAIKSHQINVVPEEDNPEVGAIYILSSFDKSTSQVRETRTDGINQKIADKEDYKSSTHIVWSRSFHFVMNGKGEILSEEIVNPIAPVIPIVEIANDKDFEYWIKAGGDVTDFTVEYNASLSSLAQIVNMQCFAQAYLKAPEELQPKTLKIGPNHIIRLTTAPGLGADVDFGYAQTGSDIAGAQAFNDSLLAQFLSSQGLDSSSVVGKSETNNFSSGVERLLALIEKFDASKETMEILRHAESKIYEVFKAWINISNGTDLLDKKYQCGIIPEDSEVSVTYKKPESVLTEEDRLNLWKAKNDSGLASRVDYIMEQEGLDMESARLRLQEIDQNDIGRIGAIPLRDQPND
jgi:hypothetical protein